MRIVKNKLLCLCGRLAKNKYYNIDIVIKRDF